MSHEHELTASADGFVLQPSTRINEWARDFAFLAQTCMDNRENPPALDACPECECTVTPVPCSVYRCLDCHIPAPVCKDCILKHHRHRPFDRLRVWDREQKFWRGKTTADLGYVWRLGHWGDPCPSDAADVKQMTVVHEHGIMKLPIQFCACEGAPSHTEQLIQAGLWPATWKRPGTATTITALDTFHALEMQAQLNIHDYVNYLRQATDDVAPHRVPVGFGNV